MKVGRPGQSQNGVDVHGIALPGGESVGIQCKRMDDLDDNNEPCPGGPITRKVLLEEYQKACTFHPKLKLWILATTAKRDGKIQAEARGLDEESRRAGRFSVKLWFWEDYVTYLNCYDDLVEFYYSSVMKLRSHRDQDKAILEVFTMALSRPAFHTSFQREHADNFEQALKDSQTAIETGELVSRETRHVIRKAIGGWRAIDDPRWRDACREISGKLRDLRSRIRDGIKDGSIIRTANDGMSVRDVLTEKELLGLRKACVDEINQILSDAGLPLV